MRATNGEVPALSVNGPKLTKVATLTRAMTPPTGAWAQVQVYHLIRSGSYRPVGSPYFSWDCRKGVTHVTSAAESSTVPTTSSPLWTLPASQG